METQSPVADELLIRRAVEQLLDELPKPRISNRRSEKRTELVAPVTVRERHSQAVVQSALAIDISAAGTKLVHRDAPLPPGEYILSMETSKSGRVIAFRSDVEFSESCGGGWFSSGCRFLAVTRV